jgi:hypothetical protein
VIEPDLTAPIRRTRVVREKTLRHAIQAVRDLDDPDVVMVLAAMMEKRNRFQLDGLMAKAEKLFKGMTTK